MYVLQLYVVFVGELLDDVPLGVVSCVPAGVVVEANLFHYKLVGLSNLAKNVPYIELPEWIHLLALLFLPTFTNSLLASRLRTQG
jgi:hypothetical protein